MTHAMMNHLWQSTFFAAAAGMLTLAFRRNGAHTRYGLWFAASCKFLIPFSALTALGGYLHPGWGTAHSVTMPPVLGTFAQPFFHAPAAVPSSSPLVLALPVSSPGIDPSWIWLGLWACGAAAVGIFWMVRWRRINAMRRSATPLPMDAPIPVRQSASRIEPGVVGIFTPVLLMPEGIFDRLTPQQLQLVLTHEMAHARRRDNLTAAIHMLVEALFWFHPLVWWMGRRLMAEREAACDEAVMASGGDPETYAEGLLAVCKFYLESPLECAAGVSGADLKKRIEFIMMPRVMLQLSALRKALLATAAVTTLLLPVAMGSASGTLTHTLTPPVNYTGEGFQTVSIRESQPGNGFPHDNVAPDAYRTENFSLKSIIAFAYDTQDALIVGPTTLDAKYNIDASAPGAFTADGYAGVDKARALVRKMLAERFRLKVSRSTRQVSAYVLTADPAGTHLQESGPKDEGPYCMFPPTSIECNAVRIGDFAEMLVLHQLGRAVLDETGLTKTYDFKLDWKADSSPTIATGGPSSHAQRAIGAEVLRRTLQSQLGLVLRPEEATAEVLVVDRVELPRNLLPAHKAMLMNPQTFDSFVGHYEFPGTWIMTISRDQEHFWTQFQGQSRVEIFPKGTHDFFASRVEAQFTFISDAQGRTTGLVLHQNGQDIPAPRMDEATAQKMIDALDARIKNNTPVPGSEETLRRFISDRATGKPNYDQMSPQLAAAVRAQLPVTLRLLAKLGPLNSLKFTKVDPMGADIYHVQFAYGSGEWQIHLAPDGKVDGAWYDLHDKPEAQR